MSVVHTRGVGQRVGINVSTERGEIRALDIPRMDVVMRAQLMPGEEGASLAMPISKLPSTIAPLTRYLGPLLTIANPGWSADPIPRMRRLQKVLVGHSLTLEEGDRSECMEAIAVVENAVQLRLRLQQMRMSLGELEKEPEVGGVR